MRHRFSLDRFSLTRSGLFTIAVAMAVLLGVLAILQFRWVGQLSNDERDRMRAHLNRRADGFADDFNRELTRVFFRLQIGTEIPVTGVLPSDEERFERWYATEPRANLVREIYTVDLDAQGASSLRRFQRHPARLEPAAWPEELEPIRDRLQEAMAGPDGPPATRVPLAWPQVPALVIPKPRIESAPFRMTPMLVGPGSGYTVALIDQGTMQREVIPMLVDRHFATTHNEATDHDARAEREGRVEREPKLTEPSTVHVGVIGPQGLIYPANGAPPALVSSPDAKHSLFDVRPFDWNKFVERRHADNAGGAAASVNPNGPPPPGGSRFATLTVYRDDRGTVFRNVLLGGSAQSSAWQVNVLHRAGSLDAAVGRARVRNLLVSFGVLLLLGASMGLVLVSTGRARRLAAQQMEFVAGVSHELRTPLAVIRSAAENLADGIVSEPKQVKKYGNVIASEGRRLTQMVEQIMDFAGFESGRATLDVRPAAVASVIEEAQRGAAPHLREHAAEIEQHLPAALPLVLVDPNAVSRSLQNLIVNALKYGGTPPRVTLTVTPGPREVRVTVSDNGAGIAARDLPHIFEPFYRGADVTARQIHGSGLGLSLVKRIMDQIGGRVSVTTEPGKGSAFTLHLPVAPEAQTASTPTASTTPAHTH